MKTSKSVFFTWTPLPVTVSCAPSTNIRSRPFPIPHLLRKTVEDYAQIHSLASSTLVFSTKIDTGTWKSPTPKKLPKPSLFGSGSAIGGLIRKPCTFCRRCGFETPGHGTTASTMKNQPFASPGLPRMPFGRWKRCIPRLVGLFFTAVNKPTPCSQRTKAIWSGSLA